MQELKRCPFCNYDKIHVINLAPRRKPLFAAECRFCKSQGPTADTRAGAAVLWNLANRHNFENEIDTTEIAIAKSNEKVDLLFLHVMDIISEYILENTLKELNMFWGNTLKEIE